MVLYALNCRSDRLAVDASINRDGLFLWSERGTVQRFFVFILYQRIRVIEVITYPAKRILYSFILLPQTVGDRHLKGLNVRVGNQTPLTTQ